MFIAPAAGGEKIVTPATKPRYDDWREIPKPSKKPLIPQRTKSKGIVKGPKTMPAVPAQEFDGETLFNTPDTEQSTIMDRHLKDVTKVQPAAVSPKEDETPYVLELYELEAENAKKLVIPFDGNESDISIPVQRALQQKIKDVMNENPSYRIQIQAFAAPFGTGQSSDRRLALTRALALRDLVMTADIAASHIDVRALGQQTDVRPLDRADIYFYAPGSAPD